MKIPMFRILKNVCIINSSQILISSVNEIYSPPKHINLHLLSLSQRYPIIITMALFLANYKAAIKLLQEDCDRKILCSEFCSNFPSYFPTNFLNFLQLQKNTETILKFPPNLIIYYWTDRKNQNNRTTEKTPNTVPK